MTQQEVINEAVKQLPNPATYLQDTFDVDFNAKEGSSAVIIGTSKVQEFYFKKKLPMKVKFKKVLKDDILAWDIINPLDGFKK